MNLGFPRTRENAHLKKKNLKKTFHNFSLKSFRPIIGNENKDRQWAYFSAIV